VFYILFPSDQKGSLKVQLVIEKTSKLINNLMRPNQQVYRRVEKMEITKLHNIYMHEMKFHNNWILQSYQMPRT
jgi:hypothetical protein